MAEATPDSDVSTDASSVFLETGAGYIGEPPEFPGPDVETATHAHALWLREAIIGRIGQVLADDTVGPAKREASLKVLQQVCAGAVDGLEFRNLRISAHQAQQLAEVDHPVSQEVTPVRRGRAKQVLARLACIVTGN